MKFTEHVIETTVCPSMIMFLNVTRKQIIYEVTAPQEQKIVLIRKRKMVNIWNQQIKKAGKSDSNQQKSGVDDL